MSREEGELNLATAFVDLPADAYPMTMTGYLVNDPERIIWRQVIKRPGVLFVPALAKKFGGPVGIRVEYANGKVDVQEP